jgi:hypothetical protein
MIQKKVSGIVFDNDAKDCYDWIISGNALVQMAPYIIQHFIVQSYKRASKLVGFNIVTNMSGCVLIKIGQNFSNKVGLYTDCRFNIKGNGQPTVEVVLIESEIAIRCIRKNAVEGQFDSNIH